MGELYPTADAVHEGAQAGLTGWKSSEEADFGEPEEPEDVDEVPELLHEDDAYGEPDEPEDFADGMEEEAPTEGAWLEPESPEDFDSFDPADESPQVENDAGESDEPVAPTDEEFDATPEEPVQSGTPESGDAGTGLEEDGSHGEAPAEGSDQFRLARAEVEGQAVGDRHGVDVDYTTHPISPDSANDVNQAMGKLSAEYPGVFRDLEVVQSTAAGEESTLAYAVLEPGGDEAVGIYLDSGDFRDHDALSEQGRLEEEANWTVPGGGSVEGIFHHEFGHHCAQRIFESPEANEELEAVVTEAIGLSYDTRVEPHPKETAEAIELLVSEYGATDPHEMVAECFAEYKLADDPRPLAAEIGQIIDKYLKKDAEE